MNRDKQPCVMYSKFSIVGRSEEAAQGRGYCADWEKAMPWDGQPCVLFDAARDEVPRRAFAERHKNKETESV
jgi:hypothetical protein